MGHLTAASLDAYARAQVAYGERLVASHTPDGNGCCRRCGRLAPCDLAARGRLLAEYFGDLGRGRRQSPAGWDTPTRPANEP